MPQSLNGGELYIDGQAIFGSSILLILLLAISFERILGLDKLLNKYIMEWKEKRTNEKRQQLSKNFNEQSKEDNDTSQEGPDK